MDYIEISAKNKDEAIIKASMQLETPSDELEIQVISEGSSGFLGFGAKPAIIRVRKKEASELEAEAEVKRISEEADKAIKETKAEVKTVEKAIVKEPVKEVEKEPAVVEAPVKRPIVERPRKAKHNKPKREFSRKEEVRKEPVKREQPPKRESRPIELITDENEIADIKKRAFDFLDEVFKAMKLNVEIKVEYNTEEKSLDVNFEGEDMGILIGKRGQTLDSLQYLTSLVVNKGKENYVRVKLDTEDYRKRRKETLENLSRGIAYKVRKTRRPVVLEPMNPYERRIIHSALQGNRYVETFSEGEEPYRHVVIKMKGRRPNRNNEVRNNEEQ